jgi:hypothetical protein
VAEGLPFAWAGSRFTRAFEDSCVWLVRDAPETVVSRLMRVDWATSSAWSSGSSARPRRPERTGWRVRAGSGSTRSPTARAVATCFASSVTTPGSSGPRRGEPGRPARRLRRRPRRGRLRPPRGRVEGVGAEVIRRASTQRGRLHRPVPRPPGGRRGARDAPPPTGACARKTPSGPSGSRHPLCPAPPGPTLSARASALVEELAQTNERVYRGWLLLDQLRAVYQAADAREATLLLDQ